MDFEDRYFAEVYGGDYDRRNQNGIEVAASASAA